MRLAPDVFAARHSTGCTPKLRPKGDFPGLYESIIQVLGSRFCSAVGNACRVWFMVRAVALAAARIIDGGCLQGLWPLSLQRSCARGTAGVVARVTSKVTSRVTAGVTPLVTAGVAAAAVSEITAGVTVRVASRVTVGVVA